MAIDQSLAASRNRFDSGALWSGEAGLEALSVACRMHSPQPDRFRARVVATAFDATLVTRIRTRELYTTRGRDVVDDLYADYAQIGLPIRGTARVEQFDQRNEVGAGDVILLMPGAPFRTWIADDADMAEVYLPLARLAEYGFRPEKLAEKVWSPGDAGRALRRVLVELTTGSRRPGASDGLLGQAIESLALALLLDAHNSTVPTGALRETTRFRALTYISANFAHPDLNVDTVAQHVSTSRRYLEVVFATGPGVGAVIRQARLRHAEALLLARPDLGISEVGRRSGFRGTDQFSRAFRRLFGAPPSEYRAAAVQGATERSI